MSPDFVAPRVLLSLIWGQIKDGGSNGLAVLCPLGGVGLAGNCGFRIFQLAIAIEPAHVAHAVHDALIAIHAEMSAVAERTMDAHDNPLKNAPHTAAAVCSDTWSHPYTRQVAAFPDRWTLADKFWPSVGRVDNVYGDRNLVCTCS